MNYLIAWGQCRSTYCFMILCLFPTRRKKGRRWAHPHLCNWNIVRLTKERLFLRLETGRKRIVKCTSKICYFKSEKRIKMQERKEQFLKSRIILSFLRPKWPIFNLLAVLCVIQSFKRETCVVCVHLFWAKLLCYRCSE